VRQALDANLVPFVLELLDKNLNIDNQPAVKAQLVNALKGARRAGQTRWRQLTGWAASEQHGARPVYGEQVQRILDESTVWNTYRDQRHDLFLTQATVKACSRPTSGGTKAT